MDMCSQLMNLPNYGLLSLFGSYLFMKEDPPSQLSSSILFISQGKITTPVHPSTLNSLLHIRDSNNSTTIIGIFQQGKCAQAEVFRHDESRLSRVAVEIQMDGVRLGGEQAREEKCGQLLYEGGYSGYVRDGPGTHYFQQFRKETGIWHLGKRQGQFVEEYSHEGQEEFSLIIYQNGNCQQEYQIIVRCGPKEPQFRHKKEGKIIVKEKLSQQKLLEWRIRANQAKKKIFCQEKQCELPLLNQATSHQQSTIHSNQVKQERGLTLDACQAYLQRLAHTPHCQQQARTAVLSIHTAYLFQQLKHSPDQQAAIKAKQQVKHLMLQYKGQYTLFRGFWHHIIIPLVIPSRYDHFSFIRATILPDKLDCVYYDSMLSSHRGEQMKTVYFQLVRTALLHELLKDSANSTAKKAIQDMKLRVQPNFPAQSTSDKKSCGFYMLRGIADLMQYGEVIFKQTDMSTIKRSILRALRDLTKQQ